MRRDASGHVGPLYFTPTAAPQGARRRLQRLQCRRRAEVGLHLHGGPRAPTSGCRSRAARCSRPRVGTDLVWYANYATERSIDPQFLGRGEVYIRRITLFAEGRIPQHPPAAELRSRRCARATSRTTRTAGVAVRLTPKFSVEVAGRIDETRFDADEEFDGISLQRTLEPQDDRLQRRRAPPRDAADDGGRPLRAHRGRVRATRRVRDSDSVRVMPGVEFKPRALINGQRLRRIPPVHPVGRGRAARVQRARRRSSGSPTRCSARRRSA